MTVSLCKPCGEYARELHSGGMQPINSDGTLDVSWTCWMFGGHPGCANPLPSPNPYDYPAH